VIRNRRLLRSGFAELDNVISDQQRGKQRPPVQKPYPKNAAVIELPKPGRSVAINNSLYDCLAGRQSRRKYKDQPLSLSELSYLLWATQGVRRVSPDGRMSMRTVPSGGSMHPFETYVAVNHVEGLKPGLYRYQAADHKLVFLREVKKQQDAMSEAGFGQKFVGHCAATFIWAAVPYKTEWRYVTDSAKLILLDAGHVCQNFYLACESIGCGTCAIGAYDQKKIDKLLKVDGSNELVVYLAPVGKV
jgi:SagB-type dehydrogenase family enzyme